MVPLWIGNVSYKIPEHSENRAWVNFSHLFIGVYAIWLVAVTVKVATLYPSASVSRTLVLAPAEYLVHSYNRNNLVGIVFANSAYPTRSAFSIINQVCVDSSWPGKEQMQSKRHRRVHSSLLVSLAALAKCNVTVMPWFHKSKFATTQSIER